jgi:hypothetical protein
MALIDELTGILTPEQIAKIKTAGIDKKIERGEQLADYLDRGELPPDPLVPPPAAGQITLDQLTSTLKTSLTEFEGTFTPKIETIAKTQAEAVWAAKAAEAQPTILAESTRWAHQMSQIEQDYKDLTGESFDDAKLEELNKFAKDSGKPITSPRAIYDEWVRDKRTEKMIDTKAEEKARTIVSSRSIPGVTPGAATGVRGALKTFGKAVNADGKTKTEILNEKFAELQHAG